MFRLTRWARWALIAFLVAFIAIQFVRPDRTNPASPAGASLLAKAPPDVAAILDRSCRDCHSNQTTWPWYSNVAPVSWLVADDVNHARRHLDFSKWAAYTSSDQKKLLTAACDLAQRGRMPLPIYLWMHADAKLSSADVKALCAWSDKMRDTLQ